MMWWLQSIMQIWLPVKLGLYNRETFFMFLNPAQVAKDIQTASTIDGERMFDRTEWLSKC